VAGEQRTQIGHQSAPCRPHRHEHLLVVSASATASSRSNTRASSLSHLISEEEPSASHMCARISSHTYDRQKRVNYHKQYSNVFQSLTSYYTHAGRLEGL
jgi:hypothetical protein